MHRGIGRRQADRGCRGGQHQSLGYKLTEEASAGRTEGSADGDLALAALRAHQQQTRNIDAGDQQQEAGAAEQHQDEGTDVADNHVGQRHHVRTLTVI